MSVYYNEIDPYAAQWLRNLIAAGHIAEGYVDERDIREVRPDDLRGYTQCHFFAGIGGWSYALRLAGWSDDRPVWTGSCPCQPFSAAGKQRGSDDERHLWPAFFDLIRECRPGVVFGEQVAGAAGLAWWDHVAADLEGADYAAAAANLGAHSVGAPHIRQRLYWVAHSNMLGRGEQRCAQLLDRERQAQRHDADGCSALGLVADAECGASERRGHDLAAEARGAEDEARQRQRVWHEPGAGGDSGGMADAEHAQRWPLSEHRQDGRDGPDGGRTKAYGEPRACGQVCGGVLDNSERTGLEGHRPDQVERGQAGRPRLETGSTTTTGALDAWRDLEWIDCSDGKARPTQPGLFPLAHGISNRVGRLRAYGNAIVPQVAAEFIEAYCAS